MMLVEQKTSPTTGNIFVDIDPFGENKMDFSADVQVSKRWTTTVEGNGIQCVWASAKIKMTVYEFSLAELDAMRAALECAVSHAERLDREYPPGQSVLPVVEAQEGAG